MNDLMGWSNAWKPMRWIAAVPLLSLFWCGVGCLDVVAAETPPAAPTIQDAHQFFASIVAKNELAALYAAKRDGEILGYIRFPVSRYRGDACSSAITLTSGEAISLDWTVVNKAQGSDGQIGMWYPQNVTYEFFYMITLEGGVVAQPSNNIPLLLLTITNQISRNRLQKAMNLLSSACRSKSKFD